MLSYGHWLVMCCARFLHIVFDCYSCACFNERIRYIGTFSYLLYNVHLRIAYYIDIEEQIVVLVYVHDSSGRVAQPLSVIPK